MDDTHQLISVRLEKRRSLLERGIDPYGGAFPVSGNVREIREAFVEGTVLRIAGRITAHRDMGKSHFLDLSDVTGRMQIYLSTKGLEPDDAVVFAALDLGDFLGVEGECFMTKTGEPTLKAASFKLLSKAIRPLPDKWHGLADAESRQRQRYLDLITNERSRDFFEKRIRIVREIRHFFEDRGFWEVETPMMQAVAGGAAAQPFTTHHKALDLPLFLRIAPELYLKRLLVAGYPKVFELNRNFRNEGISRRHNPEFTMLEAYWAGADFSTMADLVETLITHLADHVAGGPIVEHRDEAGEITRTINLSRPWKRARYADLIAAAEPGWFERDKSSMQIRLKELGISWDPAMEPFELTQQIFEKLVEEKQIDPLFVTHLPAQLVPLARQNADDPALVDVYELIINGQEISPGYSELNDPVVQRSRLEAQAGAEQQKIDEDFLTALEHGMPPAGGIGIGIDRLVMLLTGAPSIRDVIFFPLLRPPNA